MSDCVGNPEAKAQAEQRERSRMSGIVVKSETPASHGKHRETLKHFSKRIHISNTASLGDFYSASEFYN